MFKKAWIAAFAVVVGLIVLSLTGTKVGGMLRMKMRDIQQAAEEQVTPETDIRLIEEELDKLAKQDRRYVDQLARDNIGVQDLEKQIETQRVALKRVDDEGRAAFAALQNAGKAELVSFNGGSYRRDLMEQRLQSRLDQVRLLEGNLKSQEDRLKMLTERRDLHQKQRRQLKASCEELSTKLERIRNALEVERLAQEKSSVLDDGSAPRIRAKINALDRKLRVLQERRRLDGTTDEDPIAADQAERQRRAQNEKDARARWGAQPGVAAKGDTD